MQRQPSILQERDRKFILQETNKGWMMKETLLDHRCQAHSARASRGKSPILWWVPGWSLAGKEKMTSDGASAFSSPHTLAASLSPPRTVIMVSLDCAISWNGAFRTAYAFFPSLMIAATSVARSHAPPNTFGFERDTLRELETIGELRLRTHLIPKKTKYTRYSPRPPRRKQT